MSDGPGDFDAFYRHDFVAVIAFLRKAGFGREEAEDASAEAMTYAYENWHKIASSHSSAE